MRGALAAIWWALAAMLLATSGVQAAGFGAHAESKIIVRADSAAVFAVGGGRVVALSGGTADGVRVLNTTVAHRGHLFRVAVNPQTDRTVSIVKLR